MRVLSVVIPVYNEASQLPRTLEVLRGVLGGVQEDLSWTFVLVDDGSRDGTWEVIRAESARGDVRGLRLSRNFGKEAALCAGLEAASGDGCLVLDGDLQHPPALIPAMLDLWIRQGYDVVEGVKARRGDESLLYRLCAVGFYRLMKALSGCDFDNASDFKLLDARVLDAWRRLGESRTFFRGMTAWLGFRRASLPFEVSPREGGGTRWSPFKLLRLALDAIASFSSAPLHLVTALGGVFFLFALLLGGQTLYRKLAGSAVDGFTTVILLLLVIGSTLMFSLGIIGVYVSRIFDEVKGRPRYLVCEEVRENREEVPRK